MSRSAPVALLALCCGAALLAASAARAQAPAVVATFQKIRGVDAVISRPATPGPKSHVAIVIMHDNSDSLDNLEAPRLAAAGYIVISTNARTGPDPEDHDTNWDNVLSDVRTVMRYARALPGVTKVVLSGHSSGAPLMAAYDNIAENGVKACNGPEKISKCPDSFNDFPKADGLILLDPIFGVGTVTLNSVDPALDSFNPANGFAKTGAHYPADFKKRFFAAQAARNNRLIEAALARQALIKAGKGKFSDDEPFLVPGATRYPKLYRPDLSLLSHTREAHTLIKGDGTVTTEVIHSVRVPSGTDPVSEHLQDGALGTSVNRYLSTFATRTLPGYEVTEDAIHGVDWASSNTNTPYNVQGVTVPLLVMGMTGHYWLVSAEMAYNGAKSSDKTVAYVEGAVHGFTPCTACAKTPGEYGDTVAHVFDYVTQWLDKRF